MPVRALARVNVAAIERNCARLRRDLAAGTALGVVVKADGYGHGAVECARAARAGGATRLAVAAAGEAEGLRAALPDAPILTMGALTGTINVLTISILQRATPREFRGRVMGTFTTITRALVPVALVVGGGLADATDRNVPLVYTTCGVVTLATLTMLTSRRARLPRRSAP